MGHKRRRTAEQAQELILEAAERMLAHRGPGGLRLQELAAEVHMSHPAILHHFGSREGLVQAVLERAVRRLESHVLATLGSDPVDEQAAISMLEHVFRALGDQGNARLLAWLYLSPLDIDVDPIGYGSRLKLIADTIHRRRCSMLPDAEPSSEDTLFTVLLAGLALFGNAVAGPAMRASAGLGPDANERFIAWLARFLRDYLIQPGQGSRR